MFRSWLIVAVLLVFFGGVAVLAFGSGFRARASTRGWIQLRRLPRPW